MEKKIKTANKVKTRFRKAFKSLNKISLSAEDKKKVQEAQNPIDALINELIERYLLPNEPQYSPEPYKVPETPNNLTEGNPAYLNENGIM